MEKNESGRSIAAAVEPQGAASAPADAAGFISASVSVPKFGGNRGGRKRKDGLVAGSAEAVAADKEADAQRKRAARQEAVRLAEPPPLPAAGPGLANPPGPAMPGAESVAIAAVIVPWEVEKLKGLTDDLIDTAEGMDVEGVVKVAVEGKLPDPVIKKITKDSAWHPVGKCMLKRSAPRVAAKWLNKTGISGEFQDELEFGGGTMMILRQRSELVRELREMIAELKAAATKQPEEVKP